MQKMQRIAIMGCGGSGKSMLARRLGNMLMLPVYHLDRSYWNPGWIETPRDEWTEIHRSLCDEQTWIMDGNYGSTMNLRLSRADTVIFLDMPTWSCLMGALRRYLRYRGRTRPELPDGCPERLSPDYIKWIWTYRSTRRPRILKLLHDLESVKQVVILDSRPAVEAFLTALSESQPADASRGRRRGDCAGADRVAPRPSC